MQRLPPQPQRSRRRSRANRNWPLVLRNGITWTLHENIEMLRCSSLHHSVSTCYTVLLVHREIVCVPSGDRPSVGVVFELYKRLNVYMNSMRAIKRERFLADKR